MVVATFVIFAATDRLGSAPTTVTVNEAPIRANDTLSHGKGLTVGEIYEKERRPPGWCL